MYSINVGINLYIYRYMDMAHYIKDSVLQQEKNVFCIPIIIFTLSH